LQSSLSQTSGPEENRAVTEGIRVLGEFISRKQTNLSALTSIVEVKVETALISEEKQGRSLFKYSNLSDIQVSISSHLFYVAALQGYIFCFRRYV
jgi:hypothetical protein